MPGIDGKLPTQLLRASKRRLIASTFVVIEYRLHTNVSRGLRLRTVDPGIRCHGFICRRRESAAYKKQVLGLSSKPARLVRLNQTSCLQSVLISAAPWDRRRGCRGAGSPACCRHRVSARGSPDQRPAADTTRRRISPVCRRAARRAGRLWCLQAQRSLAAAPVASARSQWHARPPVAPSGPAAAPAPAGLAREPRLTAP